MSLNRSPQLTVSIVICTRQRAPMLAGTLSAHLTDRSRVDRELIVVDNASTDDTRRVVEEAAAEASFPIGYVFEPRIGVSRARNRGISHANGALVLFTDDDVLVEDGWADEMVRPFEDPGVGAVGGRVLPMWSHPPPAWLKGPHADLITMVDRGEEPRRYSPDEAPSGASMAIRISALDGLPGPFDPRLGRTGDDAMAGEENDLLFALHDRGWTLAYTPAARSWHRITPDRMLWAAMLRQHFGSGIAHARVERKRRGRAEGDLAHRSVWLARAMRRALRDAGRPPPVTAEEASGRLDAWMWLGYRIEALLGAAPPLARSVERLLQPRRRS